MAKDDAGAAAIAIAIDNHVIIKELYLIMRISNLIRCAHGMPPVFGIPCPID
jgi:hypothetical protein